MSCFTPTTRIITSTDGVTIYSDAIGDPTKPSVVFIHGFSLSGACFDRLFTDKNLLDRFYLVRYDLRGHGRSGKPSTPEGYISSLFADDFASVISAYALVKPVLIGWSYGASIICDICTHLSPLPVSGAVSLSGGPRRPLSPHSITTDLAAAFRSFTSTTDAIGATASRITFIDDLFVNPSAVPFDIKTKWLGMTVMQPPHVSALLISRTQDPTTLFNMGKKGLPLLIIGGTKDKLVKSDVIAEEMKHHFSNMEVVLVEGGGHTIFYENQEETVQKLTDFIHRITSSSARVAFMLSIDYARSYMSSVCKNDRTQIDV